MHHCHHHLFADSTHRVTCIVAYRPCHPTSFTIAITMPLISVASVIRVLVSITVIMVDTTGMSTFVSPFMIVTLASRFTGKSMFGSEGIYDEILKLRKIPFLEEQVSANNEEKLSAP